MVSPKEPLTVSIDQDDFLKKLGAMKTLVGKGDWVYIHTAASILHMSPRTLRRKIRGLEELHGVTLTRKRGGDPRRSRIQVCLPKLNNLETVENPLKTRDEMHARIDELEEKLDALTGYVSDLKRLLINQK
jgi:DNA-binding transcriptional ArsR family regulator